MTKNFFLCSALGAFLLLCSCEKKPSSSQGDHHIDSLVSALTLEEKVGQMTNLTLSTIAFEKSGKIFLDTAKVKDAIVAHHIGSIQNVINKAYSLEEWRPMIDALQRITLEQTRHKVPFLYCIDAVHGANYVYGSTLFPHNIGLAATRNPELVEKCAAITAAETRAAGIRYNFSPVLDVGRNQQWSRLGETFGEDTYLVTQLGVAAIRGFEGDDVSRLDKVASCMKHYVGYSVPQNGKDRAPAYIPEIVLREHFLPSFQQAIKQGAKTLMVNSGEINGTPVHASKYLLTDVLRKELGFTGVVISDWQDILKLTERHRVAKDHKDAVLLAVNAGIDMCIVPFDFSFYEDLLALVKEGKITEERINESVRRILTLKKQVGLFQDPYVEKESLAQFGKPEYQETTLQAALESITLLKNEGNVLPLSSASRVLVTGPNAASITALHDAWSYAWQGNKDSVYPAGLQSIADVFKQNGAQYTPAPTTGAARSAEAILVCLGEAAYAETPGNIEDLDFDEKQVELVQQLAKTGKPIIAVLLEGRPRIIRKIEPYCKAILLAYWPGPKGAQAIHDVVVGTYNPSGKLPFTYPRFSGTLITYDHKLLDEAIEIPEPYKYFYEFKPQYPFGHGLSYTTFQYGTLKMDKDTVTLSDSISVSFTLSNAGSRAGHEVVELYTQDLVASITPAVKRLRKFKKIYLKAGESVEVRFRLHPRELAFVNEALQWVTEEGAFEILIGNQKRTFYLKN